MEGDVLVPEKLGEELALEGTQVRQAAEVVLQGGQVELPTAEGQLSERETVRQSLQ